MFAGRTAVGKPDTKLLTPSAPVLLTLFVLVLSLFAKAGAESQDKPAPYVISQEVNLVALPVVVRDRQGRFASGLQASNFHVREDGRPQTITLFRNEDIPVTVGLVVDHSGSMAARQLEVIEGAQAFVQASNPQDREFVINFGETVSFGLPPNVPFTNDANVLRAALSSPYASGRTALYDAILVAMQHLQVDDREKKVLILISDGGDSASRHRLSDVLRTAQSTGVVIYAIGLLDEHNADQNPKVLQKLTAITAVLSEFFRRGYEGLPGHRCRHPSPIYGGVFSTGQRATGLPESSRQRDRAWSRKTFCAYARRLLSTSQNPSINSAFGRRTESIICAVRRS